MRASLICLSLTIGSFAAVAAAASAAAPDFEQRVQDGLSRLHIDLQTKAIDHPEEILTYFPEELKEVVSAIKKYFMGKSNGYKTTKRENALTCTSCIAGVNFGIGVFEAGTPLFLIEKTATKLCSVVLDEQLCQGIIKAYLPQLAYIIEHASDLDGQHFCSLTLGGKCGAWGDIYGWTVDYEDNSLKPKLEAPKPPAKNAKKSKVLHLTDIHMDLSYKVGTDTDCGLPLCCMNSTKEADDPFKGAGYWGNFYCDTPVWTLENMLTHIKQDHDDIDYIMLTGDYPAHDLWLQSHSSVDEHNERVISLVKKYFPDKIVIPNVGNHDAFPCNSVPPSTVSEPKWSAANNLYNPLVKYFGDWLDADSKASFTKEGFFTFLLYPGFRIISINSNQHLGYNFWINLNYKDPGNQLKWIYDVLLQAEKDGEKVHIVGHAPFSDDTVVSGWAKNFAELVDRFANTITGQFYGHTHNDQFLVFYDTETNSIPVNVAFVTPSVTTYTGLNPSYRIFTLDGPYEGASMRVIDVDTYIFDLLEANEEGEDVRPRYFKLYDHRKDLDMNNLFPEDFDQVARRLATDDEFYAKFFRYYNSDSWGDDHSRRKVVCTMIMAVPVDDRKCIEIMGPEAEED